MYATVVDDDGTWVALLERDLGVMEEAVRQLAEKTTKRTPALDLLLPQAAGAVKKHVSSACENVSQWAPALDLLSQAAGGDLARELAAKGVDLPALTSQQDQPPPC